MDRYAIQTLLGKTPFLRLLVPVVSGIVLGRIATELVSIALPVALAGLLTMGVSFFIAPPQQFRFRWVFGVGCFLFLFSVALHQLSQHTQTTRLTPSRYGEYALGAITDLPTIKPRSIAVNVRTAPPQRRKIILYLEKSDEARALMPGDEIVFRTTLQAFKNSGNPDDFDYAGYMQMKGFSGSGYVSTDDWRKTGRQEKSIAMMAQRTRGKVLDFYRSLGLDTDAYAFICAITLGYKGHLSDDLQAAFRASGTAHVLALSGLHVGIIYAVINMLFSFLGKNGTVFIARQWLVILALWFFVFVVGMTASVVRAAIMLTLFSMGQLYHRRGFSYNSLAAAAFLILVFRPMALFDVGFQMSFGAVFSILFLNRKLTQLYHPKNGITKYIWNLVCINTTAQLGVSPLVLYHFGTFPTWFFVTNLLVVPLVGVVIYGAFPLLLAGLLQFLQWDILTRLYAIFQWVEQTLIALLLKIVYISESLPWAQISDIKISLSQLLTLLLFIYTLALFFFQRKPGVLIVSLSALLFFQLTSIHEKVSHQHPQLVVFNNRNRSEIALFHRNKRHYIPIPESGFLPYPPKRVLLLSGMDILAINNSKQMRISNMRLKTDVLILSWKPHAEAQVQNEAERKWYVLKGDDIENLINVFQPETVVLDATMPRYLSGRVARQCASLGVMVHDVTQNGAFSLFF